MCGRELSLEEAELAANRDVLSTVSSGYRVDARPNGPRPHGKRPSLSAGRWKDGLSMNRSTLRLGLVVLLAAVFCATGTFAYAQGGTSQTLSGTVVDTSGAVIPGADIVAKHVATGISTTAVSNSEGIFSIASLPIGSYTVTVTLSGFKTVVVSGVVLTSGAGASVKAVLEVG